METKKIGTVLIESGKMMIFDPLFIPEWKDSEPQRVYKYLPTQKMYEYNKDFNNYQEIIEEEKTVNQLIVEKKLIPVSTETIDFSYASMLESMQYTGMWQAMFENGQEGLAFALSVDDGIYDIMGEWHGEKLKKIWIEF